MRIETIKKWIKKAENDLKIGKDEFITKNPATDAICFHMQQCAEKYLKIFLIFNDKEISKTHDIWSLINKCCEIDNEFSILKNRGTEILSGYAVEVRYPDDFYEPSMEETKRAVDTAEKVKEFVLQKLYKKGFNL